MYIRLTSLAVACLDGYESVDGRLCEPCKNGNYGRKCGYSCICLENEKCHHINGCINSQHDLTEAVPVSTELLAYTPTMTEFYVIWLTTLSTTIRKDSTVRIVITGRRRTTPRTEANDIGLNDREIIVYSICAGTFAFIILLCTMCQRRYRRIYGNFKYQIRNARKRNIQNSQITEIPLADNEGIYEMIDESNMIDNFENLRNSNNSDTNGGYVQPDDNGYLTPYQPADEEANTNNSNATIPESAGSSETTDQTTSDCESTSTSSYIQGRRSSYLNPYQPIVHSADIHEYLSTRNTYGYGSDTLTKESEYLNQYQTVVPDSDLHDCKYVFGCSDVGSGSSMSVTCHTEIPVRFAHSYQDVKLKIETHVYKSVNSV